VTTRSTKRWVFRPIDSLDQKRVEGIPVPFFLRELVHALMRRQRAAAAHDGHRRVCRATPVCGRPKAREHVHRVPTSARIGAGCPRAKDRGAPYLKFVNSRGEALYSTLADGPSLTNGFLAWAPDGKRLAAVGVPGSANAAIWIVQPDKRRTVSEAPRASWRSASTSHHLDGRWFVSSAAVTQQAVRGALH
jgi:hypothetical protein